MTNPLVGIIMGSDSDLAIMQEAATFFEEFGISYELTIVSAHRTPDRMVDYAKSANGRGLKVIIAGAGGAAHLPGMVASITQLPVIGVPIKAKNLDGLDSLLSIAQMPAGVPVATVAINGAKNAGILAAKIIGTFDKDVEEKIKKYQVKLHDVVLKKAEELEKFGIKKYLEKVKRK